MHNFQSKYGTGNGSGICDVAILATNIVWNRPSAETSKCHKHKLSTGLTIGIDRPNSMLSESLWRLKLASALCPMRFAAGGICSFVRLKTAAIMWAFQPVPLEMEVDRVPVSSSLLNRDASPKDFSFNYTADHVLGIRLSFPSLQRSLVIVNIMLHVT